MEVQAIYGDQVRFIGMPGLGAMGSMNEFVADNGVGAFPHIPDPDGALWEEFGVHQQRSYVFVNDDGTFRSGTYGQLESDVEDLIAT